MDIPVRNSRDVSLEIFRRSRVFVSGSRTIAADAENNIMIMDRISSPGTYSSNSDRCPENPCPPENEELGDKIVLMSTISTVGFIAGGAAVAGGVLWLVLQGSFDGEDEGGDASATTHVRLMVGGPYVGLEGTF